MVTLKRCAPKAKKIIKAQLQTNDRAVIIGRIIAGHTQAVIAKDYGVSQSTVSAIATNFNTCRSVERKPGSGRKRKTNQKDDQRILSIVRRNRFITSKELQKEQFLSHVSTSTIRRRISESREFSSYWACKKPYLREANRLKRLRWAREHLHGTKEQWSKVLWSDESPYVLRYDARKRVWRMGNERYK